MGTGPLVIPPAIAQVGFLLGVSVLLVFALISAVTAEYVIECLGACNQESITNSNEINHIFEYSQMGKKLWGRKGEIMNTIAIVLYLFGTITTKGIIVGHTLTSLFPSTPVLNNFYFWAIFFYFISGVLSFKDISNIAIIQTLIASVRYLSIAVMILASFIVIKQNHQIVTPKEWDMSRISNLFGTAVLAYMMHHSLPSVLGPCQPANKIKGIIYGCFLMGYLILVVVSLTGIMAFKNLQQDCFYNVAFNQEGIMWAYYIISFYIFLNISGVPVLTIVTRKTLLNTLAPHLITENQYELTKESCGITLMILVNCCVIAICLRDHVELVIALTGGICGIIIMLLLPSLMVIKFRERVKDNKFESYFKSNNLAFGIIIISILCMIYNVYIQVDKYINPQTLCSTH